MEDSASGILVVLLFFVGICVIVAWFLSITMFIDAAKAKGYPMRETGVLWFVGIFASPLVPGLYVNALPPKNNEDSQER